MNCSPEICLKNIYFLSKHNDIKIGDLESMAGVSAGYFSRLNKKESLTFPQVEILAKVAHHLNVTIDALVSIDFSSLFSIDIPIINFIDQLNNSTKIDKAVTWQSIHYENIIQAQGLSTDSIPMDISPIITIFDPLANAKKGADVLNDVFQVESPRQRTVVYKSLITPDDTMRIAGDFYYHRIEENVILLLTKLTSFTRILETYEIYLFENDEIYPLASTAERPNSALETSIVNLYTSARDSSESKTISENALRIINKYINKS